MATQLNIREQPSLRWSKETEIAVDGMHYRILRSMLTLGVVVLAVAFLTNILMESRIAAACKRGVHDQAVQQRELVMLAAFTDVPLNPRELAARIASLRPGAWPLSALAGWLGLPGESVDRFQADCRAWQDTEQWLDERAPGHRRLLAGKRDIEETFALLEDESERRAFAESARLIPLQLPAGFLDFTARRRAFLSSLDEVANCFARARSRFAIARGNRTLADWLAGGEAGGVAPVLAEHGLTVKPDRLDSLLRRAREREEERLLLNRLRLPSLPTAWRERFNEVFEQNTALVRLSADPARADWLVAQPAPAGSVPALEARQAAAAAARILEARRLSDVEDRLLAQYGNRPGLSANLFWLLVVSFLVCMAGITNAMLLSVIERFREIATMKCLGALNGFIARLFLLEAAALGLVGGILGVLLGGAIGVTRMTLAYGDWVGRFFPWSGLASMAGLAASCGLVLATLSALYPAWSAARMPPIEAMRVE
ncbi:MAG: FtsX-like permease family protein [Kiritimatiellia bacterium]